MAVEKPKKRPWFQLHLSTCIVLMFVAGSLLCINIFGRTAIWERGPYTVEARVYGWPWEVWAIVLRAEHNTDKGRTAFDSAMLSEGQALVEKSLLNSWPIAANVTKNGVILLGIMFGVGLLTESLIRRRERKRVEEKGDERLE